MKKKILILDDKETIAKVLSIYLMSDYDVQWLPDGLQGVKWLQAGKQLGDISSAVRDHCERQKYGIVRELTGHGIGREMHEDPQVPNYGRRGNGVMLKAGMCIAIEPMVTMGKREIWLDQDRWTIRTQDGKPAAHFEHTITVRKGKAEILSSFEEIEELEGKQY